MTSPQLEVVSLTDLHLDHGQCDVCGTEGWVILVIISSKLPIAFYICDADRRDMIYKLSAAR